MKSFSFVAMASLSAFVCADWPCLFQPGGEAEGRQMLVTHDGGAVLICSRGPSFSWINVARIAPDGTVLWKNNIDSGMGSVGFRDVAIDTHDNVIVSGYGADFGLGEHWITAKLDAMTGERQWVKRDYGSAKKYYNFPNSVVTDSQDNVYVVGMITRLGKIRLRLAKYAPDGTRGWENLMDGYGQPQLVIAPDDSIFMCGQMANGTDLTTSKLTNKGKQIWSTDTMPPEYGQLTPLRMIMDGAGNVVVGAQWLARMARPDLGC